MKLFFDKIVGNEFFIHMVEISYEEIYGVRDMGLVNRINIGGVLLDGPSDHFIFMGGTNNLRVSWKSIVEKISERFGSMITMETNFKFTFKDKGDEAAFNFYLYDGIEI
jgi:hypothetical protein